MNTTKEIELDKLIPTSENPRKITKKADDDLKALAKSIGARGVFHPVIARPHPEKKGFFDLRAGARRCRAAAIVGLKTIPVNVLKLTDREAAEITIAENKHRKDLHPLEEAAAVALLLKHSSVEDAAATYDKSVPWIRRRAKLADLSPCWKTIAQSEDTESYYSQWPSRNYEMIARLPRKTQEAIHGNLEQNPHNFPHTYSDLKRYLAKFINLLAGAPWGLDETDLVKGSTACDKCPNRSSQDLELFDDLEPVAKKNQSDNRCLDPLCWDKKTVASTGRALAKALEIHGNKLHIISRSGCDEDNYKKFTGDYEPTRICDYEITHAKKTDAGAIPVFDLQSARLYWAKKQRYGQSSSAGKTKSSGPTPLAERREKLQKRREVKAVAMLIEMLADAVTNTHTKIVLKPDDLICTLAVFGTDFNRGARRDSYIPDDREGVRQILKLEEDWDIFLDLPTVKIAATRLFQSLMGVFIERLNPKDWDAPHTADAKKIANHLDINFDEMLADAAAGISEPASWADLNSNGTKKVKPKPAKKTTAKKAKKRTKK